MERGLWRTQCMLVLLLCVCGASLDGIPSRVELLSPEELLKSGLQFYQGCDYQQAGECWIRLIQMYESDASHQLSSLEYRLLPLLGYSLYRSGRYNESQQYLQRYLDRFGDGGVEWVVLLVGRNKVALGDIAGALEVWRQVQRSAKDSVHVALSLWYQIEQTLSFERNDEYRSLLETLRGLQVIPRWMSADAALRVAYLLSDMGRNKESAEVILTMGQRGELQIDPYGQRRLSLALASTLLQNEQTKDALMLLRGVVPAELLQKTQGQWVLHLHQWMLRDNGSYLQNEFNPLWGEYLMQSYQRARLHQQAIALGVNDMSSFYQIYAQVLIREKRLREAWIVLEELSLGEEYAQDAREQAHYMWIVTACQMERWSDAALLIESFADLYPESPLAIDASYMMVQVLSGNGEYVEAILLLGQLIESYSKHPMQEHWRYHRGYLRIKARQYDAAREDLMWVISRGDAARLRYECLLWSGISYLLQNHLAEAADMLRTGLDAVSAGHPLHPDFLYWTASVEYSLQQELRAEALLDEFMSRYPLHLRVDEVISLKGDLRMRAADFTTALECFQRVGSESHMYPHAVFRVAEILQHTGSFEKRAQHLHDYARQEISGKCRRVAEAMRLLTDDSSATYPMDLLLRSYMELLERCGNRMDATDAILLLKDFAKYASQNRDVAESESIGQWLDRQQEDASLAGRVTWYGRLIFLQVLLSSHGLDDELAHDKWLDLRSVSLGEIDAEIGARLGLSLLRHSEIDAARDCLMHVMERSDDPDVLVIANYAMALLMLETGAYESAIEYGERADKPMKDHRLSAKVKMHRIESYLAGGYYSEAIHYCDQVLQSRRYRGRVHAECLMYKASAYVAMQKYADALLCYQRVYSIYRGYEDLAIKSLTESAHLLEESGNQMEALQMWDKIVEWPSDVDVQIKEQAVLQRARIRKILQEKGVEAS
jgi:outer membrane protein assembly factor BamD (BamD/ComL family)